MFKGKKFDNLETKATKEQIQHWENLYELFNKNPMPQNELFSNFGLFMKSSALAKILFLNEIYEKISKIPGDIVEFGVWRGQNIITFENLRAIHYYAKKTHTRISFEYVMIDGINDREEDFFELVKICKSLPCKINVIPFNSLKHMNPTGFSAELKPTPKERIEAFVEALREQNIIVTVRFTQGDDIAAACGQLAYP